MLFYPRFEKDGVLRNDLIYRGRADKEDDILTDQGIRNKMMKQILTRIWTI